ncbi:hypothetical protein [Photobacterium kasasachensis]|uniref:hypothetical protein n=1 Tax=Photobacterium kasasachensis TaxID=2910240 RepID=UPI003D145F60
MKYPTACTMLCISLLASQSHADTFLSFQQTPNAELGAAFNPHTLGVSNFTCIEGEVVKTGNSEGAFTIASNIQVENWLDSRPSNGIPDVSLPVLAGMKAKKLHIGMSADRFSDTYSIISEPRTKSAVLNSKSDGRYNITEACQPYIGDPDRHINLGTEFIHEVYYGALFIASLKINFFDEETRRANVRLKDTIRMHDFNLQDVPSEYLNKISMTVSAMQLGGEPSQLDKLISEKGMTCSLEEYTRCLNSYQALIDYISEKVPNQFQNHEDYAVMGYKAASFESGYISELISGHADIQTSDATKAIHEELTDEYHKNLADNSRATILLTQFANLLTPAQQNQVEEIIKSTELNMGLYQDIYQGCLAEPYGEACTEYYRNNIDKLQGYDGERLSMSVTNTGESITGRYFGRYQLGLFGKHSIDSVGYWLWDFDQQQVVWGGTRKLPTGINAVSLLPTPLTNKGDSNSFPLVDNQDGTYSLSYINADTTQTAMFKVELLENGGLAITPVETNYSLLHLRSTLGKYGIDSDDDLMPDLIEQAYRMDINQQDSDQDGLSDEQEIGLLVMPNDTDLDGIPDVLEAGSDADNRHILGGIGLASGEQVSVILDEYSDTWLFVDSTQPLVLGEAEQISAGNTVLAGISAKNQSESNVIDRLDMVVSGKKVTQGIVKATIKFKGQVPEGLTIVQRVDNGSINHKVLPWSFSPNQPHGVDVQMSAGQKPVERITLLLAKASTDQAKPQGTTSGETGGKEAAGNASGGSVGSWLMLALMLVFGCRLSKRGSIVH